MVVLTRTAAPWGQSAAPPHLTLSRLALVSVLALAAALAKVQGLITWPSHAYTPLKHNVSSRSLVKAAANNPPPRSRSASAGSALPRSPSLGAASRASVHTCVNWPQMSGYCGDNGVINSCNKDNTVTVMVAVIVMRKKIHKTLWISINQIEMLCNCVGNYAANTADNNDGSVMVTAQQPVITKISPLIAASPKTRNKTRVNKEIQTWPPPRERPAGTVV